MLLPGRQGETRHPAPRMAGGRVPVNVGDEAGVHHEGAVAMQDISISAS